MIFEKLNEYKNLFLEKETKTLWELRNGEMTQIKYGTIVLRSENPAMSNEYPKEDMSFEDRLKAMDEKIENGEISCNLDNPEDCINCGS